MTGAGGERFSVAQWVCARRLLIVLVSALVGAGLMVSGLTPVSVADPAEAAEADDPDEKSGGGALVAPDVVAGLRIARSKGQPVEVLAERTVVSSTWALPDGRLRTGVGAGPVWVRRGGDGTKVDDWAAVDLTLRAGQDGVVRPVAHPGDVQLSGARDGGDAPLARVTMAAGQGYSFEWSGGLPTPVLAGPRATYPDVRPGVDLVVEVTRTGVEQYFVIRKRPAAGAALGLSSLLSVSGGTARHAADGGVELVDKAGRVTGRVPVPQMWDASVDSGRLHPVATDWKSAGETTTGGLSALPAVKDLADPATQKVRGPGEEKDRGVAPSTDKVTQLPAPRGPDPDALEGRSSVVAGKAKAGVGRAVPAKAVVDGGRVRMDLSPGEMFLQDPGVQFPVVVDPTSVTSTFDTWVQSGTSSDQSTSAELRLGTYNGGSNVARSFVTFNISSFAGKQIRSARLDLWEWHSYSCAARNWQVWHTGAASTATRWTAQPSWYAQRASVATTKGYSSACAAGWVSADLTDPMAGAAAQSLSSITWGLRAESETDSAGWKKFNSAEAGGSVPTMWVDWNSYPNVPTTVKVLPSNPDVTSSSTYVSTATPTVSAVVSDPDPIPYVTGVFQVFSGSTGLWEGRQNGVANGGVAQVQVPAGLLTPGTTYSVRVTAIDGAAQSAWTASKAFVVDTTKPGAPLVTGSPYSNDGSWVGGAGTAGTFTFTPPSGTTDVYNYKWGVDTAPSTTVPASGGGAATVSWTPASDGPHTLQVIAYDRAGNASGTVSYPVKVGKAGLISPVEGDQVVRRVRLAVGGDTTLLPYVRFTYRRGAGSAAAAIPLSHLRLPDGSAVTSEWIPVSTLAGSCPAAGGSWTQAMADFCAQTGGYARWDAGLTFGSTGGPVQVQAQFATGAGGSGAVPTSRWTTITVDPDGDGAASDDIGPASVNLLTGDATLTGEDAAEFGISVGRTASSRDPYAGYRAQAELLSVNQQSVASDTSGFTTGTYATVTRDTATSHTGGSALKLAPKGATGDSFTTVGTSDTATPTYLTGGRRYRFSGWVFVPAATGLSPSPDPDDRGLRLVVATKATASSSWVISRSPRPSVTNAWVKLSVDVDVPAGVSQAWFRLYNGNSEASGKVVYYDDLSVQQLWAPFGPQWALSVDDDSSETAYDRVSRPETDTVLLHLSGGGEIGFYSNGAGGWTPQPGAEGLVLAVNGGGWRLTDLDGTVTEFAAQTSGNGWPVTSSSPPVADGQTRYTYTAAGGASRPSRIIAPVEPGVDGWPANAAACTSATPAKGCEVLELVYATTTTATSTTPGTVTGQVEKVLAWSWDPAAGAVTAQTAAQYAYDATGRLVSVVDPRLTTASAGIAQPTTYGYDSAGRVTTAATPGDLPWQFGYGTAGATTTGADDYIDANAGRLLTVTRAALTPARPGQAGYNTISGSTTTSVVYGVPLTRGEGGPYDLDRTAIGTWGQVEAPSDATAVFGPDTAVTSATATASTPGPNGYKPATITYLDASGAAINTASPAGPFAPVQGYIDTAEHDIHGNTVRTLEATNRLLALDVLPESAARKADLGLTGEPTATAAASLSTISTYATDGIDLVREVGPVQQLAIGNDPTNVAVVRDYSATVYDEGKPDGKTYHLATTETDAVQLPDGSLADTFVTTNSYTPVTGASALGGSSGWVHGSPTRVTVDATGPSPVSSQVVYDDRGRAIESRAAGSTGSDAGTTISAFYTSGAHPSVPACGNKPEWSGSACLTQKAAAPTGYDATRMPAALSVKNTTAYDRNGNPTQVVETLGAATRTTTTTYDVADRVVSVEITGSGVGTAVGKAVTVYDNATGNIAETRTLNGAGATVATVKKSYDQLDRMTRYEDASGAWTDTVFDTHGKPTQVLDSTGSTQTYTYDRTAEPRGYLTKISDSVAGDITATYTPDGQVATQTLPGGVTQTNDYDAAMVATGIRYTTADGPDADTEPDLIAHSSIIENGAGQWISHSSGTGQRGYAYDRLGRLVAVTDQVATNDCITRIYAYNNRAGRTARTQATAGTGQPCLTGAAVAGAAGATTTGYTYDSADRLVSTTGTGGSSAWAYNTWGRITTAPVQSDPAATSTVANTYYANDLLAAQQIAGVQRMEWTLDPLHRYDKVTTRSWDPATSGWVEASTKRNHYDGDDDSPSWVSEDATLASDITRYVQGVDDGLAVQTGSAGNVELQLVDLHGDIQATLTIEDGQSSVNLSTLALQAADEYGQPLDLDTGTSRTGNGAAPGDEHRYQWLGGQQRSAQALAGIILMGVRAYDPATGRFWSPDPEPGGNATAYDYCTGDPVNCTDLDGNWSLSKKWKKRLGKLGKIAEYGSWIPGPIGTASAAISAGAYAASGNRRKAIAMGVTAAANLVGAGAAVRVGMRAGSKALKLGRALKRAKSKCRNSFEPDTPILLADGSQAPIADIQVGDLVWTTDPLTGQSSAQPVLDTRTSYGDKHLFTITTHDPETGSSGSLTATAGHEIWVEGTGWTRTDHLTVGDQLRGATGGITLVRAMHDHGWLSHHTVHNLTIANTHTYYAGHDPSLVHNCFASQMGVQAGRHHAVYVIKFNDGSRYVGRSVNAQKRINSHFRGRGKFSGQSHNVTSIHVSRVRKNTRLTARRLEDRLIRQHVDAGYPLKGKLRNKRYECRKAGC